MAAMSHFHIPVRGSTMTPAHSPDHPVAQELSIPIRMQTPESMNSGEIPIGMALGSPARLPPDPSRWQSHFPPASPPTLVPKGPPESPPATGGPAGSLQRKKTGRRKLFGLFGGGKKEDQAQKAAERENSRTIPSKNPAASTPSIQPPKTPTRANTQTGKGGPKHKPITVRSNTMPYQPPPPVEEPLTQTNPQILRTLSSAPRARPGNDLQQPRPRIPPMPLLNVQIPDTKMERYSVMFHDVLNRGPSKEPAASLLARRQATLERLKTIKQGTELEVQPQDRDIGKLPRRATSPQPTMETPRLSIFPVPPNGRAVPTVAIPGPNSSKPVTRSNTSPGRLPSPTQQSFDARPRPSYVVTGSSRTLEVPNPFGMHPPLSGGSSKPQEPIFPTDTSFHFGADQSGLMLDSPTSMESQELEELIAAEPLKPTVYEPRWQMISPTTATSSSMKSANSDRRGRSPSAASSASHVTKPSTDMDPMEALQNAVEVSIARQISISREQRNLLRPLNTRRDTGGDRSQPSSAGGAGAAQQLRSPLASVVKSPSPSRLGRDEPIKDVQSSTPTLVHQWDHPMHRKSSWAVVEGT